MVIRVKPSAKKPALLATGNSMEVMVGKHWETEEKTLRTAVDSYYIICILCNIKNIYVIYIYI